MIPRGKSRCESETAAVLAAVLGYRFIAGVANLAARVAVSLLVFFITVRR